MMYSNKKKLDRRNSVMLAVKKELKANNAFVSPKVLQKIAASINTSRYYHVEVIRDNEAAAKRLCLVDELTANEYGSSGKREEATVVSGKVEFGVNYSHNCYDQEGYDLTDGNFDVNRPFALLMDTREWSSWCRDSDYDETVATIVIYTPELIINEEEYIAEKDAELASLCQLRDGSGYNFPKAE